MAQGRGKFGLRGTDWFWGPRRSQAFVLVARPDQEVVGDLNKPRELVIEKRNEERRQAGTAAGIAKGKK